MVETEIRKKIFIGEDEPLIAEHLKSIVRKLGHEIAGTGATETEIIKSLNNCSPDIALLDINLGGNFEGINIGRYIKDELKIPFIYITAHSDSETLRKALHTQPSSYILKPFKQADIYIALELALYSVESIKKEKDDNIKPLEKSIFVKVKGELIKIAVNDILFLKAEGNYTMIYTLKGKYLLRGNLTEVMENYLTPDFFRIHKSYCVNLAEINSIGQIHILLMDQKIPLGRTYRQSLIEKLDSLK